jgi:hypothetical protein
MKSLTLTLTLTLVITSRILITTSRNDFKIITSRNDLNIHITLRND